MYARINLSKTNYNKNLLDWRFIQNPNSAHLTEIYKTYCRYKKFKSFIPIFESEYIDPKNDIIGYYDNNTLVAFSLIRKYDTQNAEALQFAWTYHNPKLELGFKTLENECAVYKDLGFEYLYLGYADEYKSQMNGFEILGPLA
jgi:hypothetical protein